MVDYEIWTEDPTLESYRRSFSPRESMPARVENECLVYPAALLRGT